MTEVTVFPPVKVVVYGEPGEGWDPPPKHAGAHHTLMLASPVAKAKHIIFKVAAWDPTKHPKGYKGWFIDTPDQDKHPAGDAATGDVLVTKSGKVFQVEKQTEKGVKVNPVDPDSGEVKDSYTVLGNDVSVAVVDHAELAGVEKPIGELDPGTYIQHPKSHKRFVVSKHGNWTTVYPVDDAGEVKGKHTVLPKDTVVQVVPKSVGEPTPAMKEQVKEVAAGLAAKTTAHMERWGTPQDAKDLREALAKEQVPGNVVAAHALASAMATDPDEDQIAWDPALRGEMWEALLHEANEYSGGTALATYLDESIMNPASQEWNGNEAGKSMNRTEFRSAMAHAAEADEHEVTAEFYADCDQMWASALAKVQGQHPGEGMITLYRWLEFTVEDMDDDAARVHQGVVYMQTYSKLLAERMGALEANPTADDPFKHVEPGMEAVNPLDPLQDVANLGPAWSEMYRQLVRVQVERGTERATAMEVAAFWVNMLLDWKGADIDPEWSPEMWKEALEAYRRTKDAFRYDSVGNPSGSAYAAYARWEALKGFLAKEEDGTLLQGVAEKPWFMDEHTAVFQLEDEGLGEPGDTLTWQHLVSTPTDEWMQQANEALGYASPLQQAVTLTAADVMADESAKADLYAGLLSWLYDKVAAYPFDYPNLGGMGKEEFISNGTTDLYLGDDADSFAIYASNWSSDAQIEPLAKYQYEQEMKAVLASMQSAADMNAAAAAAHAPEPEGSLDVAGEDLVNKGALPRAWFMAALSGVGQELGFEATMPDHYIEGVESGEAHLTADGFADYVASLTVQAGASEGEANVSAATARERFKSVIKRVHDGFQPLEPDPLRLRQAAAITWFQDNVAPFVGVGPTGPDAEEAAQYLGDLTAADDPVNDLKATLADLLSDDKLEVAPSVDPDDLQLRAEGGRAQLEATFAAKTVMAKLPEEMPKKLPTVPPMYPAGVGEHTRLVITKTPVILVTGNLYGEDRFVLERRGPNGGVVEALGTFRNKTAAIRNARQLSAPHEEIAMAAVTVSHGESFAIADSDYDLEDGRKRAEAYAARLEPGKLALHGSMVVQVDHVEVIEAANWKGTVRALPRVYFKRRGAEDEPVRHQDIGVARDVIPIPDEGPGSLSVEEWVEHTHAGSIMWTNDVPGLAADLMEREGYVKPYPMGSPTASGKEGMEETVRAARPARWVPELQASWSYDSLVGSDWADAHAHLRALGWREIRPRQKGLVRYVNAKGRRLLVYRNEDGKVTHAGSPGGASMAIESKASARALYDELAQVMEQGGSIDDLDPLNAANPVERTSLVQRVVFDAALGRQNGVASGKEKVKTDAQYVAEIEQEGAVDSVEKFVEQVPKHPLRIKARGSVIERFGMKDDPNWDYPNRMYTVPEDANLSEEELTALVMILSRQGAADHVLGESTLSDVTPTFDPELEADDPVEGARKMAHHAQYGGFEATGVDEASAAWLTKQLDPQGDNRAKAKQVRQQADQARLDIATNMQAQAVKDEVAKRRQAEGTVPEASAEYDLPTWDDLEFQEQTLEEIEQLVSELQPGPMGAQRDIPGFYATGLVRDGVLLHRPQETWAGIELENDATVTDILKELGAQEVPNPHPIASNVSGSSPLYDGKALVLEEQSPTTGSHVKAAVQDWAEYMWAEAEVTPPDFSQVKSLMDAEAVVEDWVDALPENDAMKAELKKQYGSQLRGYLQDKGVNLGTRTIEYVPHDQESGSAGGAPTSQRGRLVLYGYSPREAVVRLRQLGIVGSLEPEVPFQQVMRSSRRVGAPVPLLPAYVRGEAPLPSSPVRLTHGLTGHGTLDSILESGGLFSIQQRYRAGILEKVHTTSISGDVRSGIDHAVFCTLGLGGACGSGSSYKVIFKPSALVVRDIVLAPNDFGGMPTRYPRYRQYLNRLQGKAKEQRTSLYVPVGPGARQEHLSSYTSLSGSNEYNVGPMVPIEDWEYLAVPASEVEEVRNKLQALLLQGRVASIPTVVANDSATLSPLASKPIKGGS